MEKLYQIAQGLNKRFPDSVDSFKMATFLLEECGEVASEISLWEDMGVKRKKHGEPSKEKLAIEIMQAVVALIKIAAYYEVENELEASIDASLALLKREGMID
ncbi:MAG: hypothetical protein FWD06_05580 [Oscillospiraceae bacterium]|nr:hypothetical protein [Oscillospiraceae bacterium]